MTRSGEEEGGRGRGGREGREEQRRKETTGEEGQAMYFQMQPQ